MDLHTIEDWCKQFPFWSRRTIVRVISSLERHGLVLTANYNRKGFDRTKWYTVNYELLAKMEAEPMPSTPSPMEKGGDNQLDEAQPEDAPGVAPTPIENGTQAPDAENPVPEANPVDGTSMMPNWHNEERRGLTGNSSSTAAVGGTSMMPDWHNQYQRITTEITQRKQQHLKTQNLRGRSLPNQSRRVCCCWLLVMGFKRKPCGNTSKSLDWSWC